MNVEYTVVLVPQGSAGWCPVGLMRLRRIETSRRWLLPFLLALLIRFSFTAQKGGNPRRGLIVHPSILIQGARK